MRVVKLKILASDIKDGNYIRSSFCPITLALGRAGLEMKSGASYLYSMSVLDRIRSSNHQELDSKVCKMYENYKFRGVEPEDFEFDLILDDYPPLEEGEHLSTIIARINQIYMRAADIKPEGWDPIWVLIIAYLIFLLTIYIVKR